VNRDLDRFEVIYRTLKKTDIRAIYTKSGELLETREMITDARVPASVMEDFSKSEYKDWKVTGGRQTISFYRNPENNSSNVEQVYRLKVENNGTEKNLTYRWRGSETFPATYTNNMHFERALEAYRASHNGSANYGSGR
jgi:hypothetical protein